MREFWSQYFDFITISKNHFIEFVITQFFDLIHEHRFEDCRILLLPFSKLKPLLLLMCLERFGDDIKSKQEILDILWSDANETAAATPVHRNRQLHDAVDSIAYQVKLARWAGSLLLQQHQHDVKSSAPSLGDAIAVSSELIVVGAQKVAGSDLPQSEPDFALANLVSSMLKQHGILYILHNYLHNVELEEIEAMIRNTPISSTPDLAEAQRAHLQTDFILLYCYYALKGICILIQQASDGSTEVSPTEIDRIQEIIAKVEVPSVHLAILEIIFNFLFMRSDAWNNPGVRVLVSRKSSKLSTFVVGYSFSFALVKMLLQSFALLKSRDTAPLSTDTLERFEAKLKELEWRLEMIRTHPYFLTPMLSIDGHQPAVKDEVDTSRVEEQTDSDTLKPISIVSVLISKPETLLIRCIRERDFSCAHSIVDFFEMNRHANSDELDVDGVSTSASHLAKVSELVYSIRSNLGSGKSFDSVIDPILSNSLPPSSSSSTQTPSSSKGLSKLEIFFLLCDMAMSSNLTGDQTTKLLEKAQLLFSEVQAQLSEDDAEHFVNYLERLKTLDRAETIQEQLPTFRGGPVTNSDSNLNSDSPQLSWIPPGLSARLMALENWPTESDALGGYLQLRSRLQGAVSRLRSIVSQSVSSREKGFASPVGLDSEDTLRKLTLFLSIDDWNPMVTSVSATPSTPAKPRDASSPASLTPSRNVSQQAPTAPYKTPSTMSAVAQSPSTVAKAAFSSLGEGYLQAFLRQLLMLGIALRDDSRVGKTDYFEHLQTAPKHLLAELVYGSRNYSKAETIANDLEVDLISLILELMGTIKPSRAQRVSDTERSGSSKLKRNDVNPSSPAAQSDLALDYMPSGLAYGANLNYEYGMSTNMTAALPIAGDSDKYTLHLNLVEYLKAQSPLVATLVCILRAPSDKYDERFLTYAISSSKRHFPPLHLWLLVKVRQFGVFYNTSLREQPNEVNFPTGAAFAQSARGSASKQSPSISSNHTIAQSSSSSALQQSQTQNALSSSRDSIGAGSLQNRSSSAANLLGSSSISTNRSQSKSALPSSSFGQITSSFDPGFDSSYGARPRIPAMGSSLASSISSMGSGIGGGGIASPTSSMNELGIDGGLQHNSMLAARAARQKHSSVAPLSLRADASRFSDEDDDDEEGANQGEADLDLSRIPGSYSPRSASQHLTATPISSSLMMMRQQEQEKDGSSSLASSLTATIMATTNNSNSNSGTTHPPSSSAPTSPRGDALCTRFPTIDILDSSEAHIFEQIFQNESLQAEVSMYLKVVEKLERSGYLQKALQLADASLPNGAPDSLLKKLIASTDNPHSAAEYILRMNNKTDAAQLALSLVSRWDIPTIMQVLFMCECHLSRLPSASSANDASQSDSKVVLDRVRDMYDRVQRYAEVLEVVKDDVQARWKSWLELDELARKDLAVVVQLLLSGGHYDIARRLTEHFKHNFLMLRVEEKYLLHLLETGDTRGVRMRLRSLEGEEAVRIAQSLMDLVTTNKDRLFLTQFIMERKSQQAKLLAEVSSNQAPQQQTSADLSNLSATELGLKILLCLPVELQKVFQPLMSSPFVIIESLLVSEQTLVLKKLFKEIPQVHDDALILKYARKALDATRLFSTADNVMFSASSATLQHGNNMSSTPSSKVVTPMAGNSDDEFPPQTIGYGPDSQEPISPYASLSKLGISQLQKKLYMADERREHSYPSAPNYPLAAGILDLCRNANLVAATCIEISDQLSARLYSIKDRLLVVRIIQQLLYYAKLRLMTSEIATLDLVQTCDVLLQRTELLLQLIFCGGTATASAVVELSKSLSLSLLADPQKARALRERLIENDLLDLALLVANKCGVESDPVWAAKALRMLETNRYQEAKQLFRYCMVSIYPEEQTDEVAQQQNRSSGGLGLVNKTVSDNSAVLSKILMILETNVPIEQDKLTMRRDALTSLVRPSSSASAAQLKDSATFHKRFKNMEDIDSSDSALKSLEALRKVPPSGSTSAPPQTIRRHTLDSIRYMQCIYYLQRFGSEEMMIKFWLRHDLLEDCIRHMDSKPPPYDTKLLLLIVNHALSRNIFPRFKEALYKIDRDVERWRDAMLALCVHFHQAKMHTILLELQVCMRDFSRAGLTSMTIYNLLSRPSEKMYYLELVQRYFTIALETWDEYLAIQQKSNSTTARLPLTKVDIAKHIKTAGLQAKLLEFMASVAPSKSNPTPETLPEDASLWGNGATKQAITETLIINHNFELAFKIIQEYRLPPDRIYREALVKMAKRKQTKKIEELLKSIKIVLSGKDLDSCHVAVARVYGMVHNDFSTAESFATKVIDQPLACEAFIACRKLKQAYLIAAKLKDLDLVRAIQAEAKRLDMKREYELCDTFLKSYDETYTKHSVQP